MYHNYIKTGTCLLIALIFILVAQNLKAGDIKAPINPVLYGDGGGRFDIYWFYPGVYATSLGNIRAVPERGVIPHRDDRQYAIFTRFDAVPPFYVEKASTYIFNYDAFPDLAGDQFSPLRLALKEKNTEDSYADLWFDFISLGHQADFPGEKISCEVNRPVMDRFELYHTLEWLPGTPTAPMVGVNRIQPYIDQMVCTMDDSSYQFIKVDARAMVGLDILNWYPADSTETIDPPFLFDVIFSASPDDIYQNGIVLKSGISDSLHANILLLESGYITIKAIAGSQEVYSEPLYIDINRLADLTIEKTGAGEITLTNNGYIPLDISAASDASVFVLSDTQISLDAGESRIISYFVKEDYILPGNYISPIIFSLSDDYYPEILQLELGNVSTDIADETDPGLPQQFSVGPAFPNPFNSRVQFRLAMPRKGTVSIDIYNIMGQKVGSQNIAAAGDASSIEWDGLDYAGREVGSGLYFFRFRSGDRVVVKRAILLK